MAEERSDEVMLPESLPLASQHYSLVPDMYFGWKPKNLSSGAPIPIQFFEEELPHALDPQTNEELPAVYYGFRPTDSLVLHKALSTNYLFNTSHPLMSAFEFLSVRNAKRPVYLPRPFLGMQKTITSLHFDSRFECGNLDKVVKLSEDEYDLYLRSDTNTEWHYQWFFFSVSNIEKERRVKFNLVNCSRNNTLFERGMRPVAKVGESGDWEHAGECLSYESSKLNKFLDRRSKFMMLSFEYFFSGKEGKMYFAESVPYTYSRVLGLVASLRKEYSQLVHKSVLCRSLGGVDVPILTITSPTVAEASKQYIIVTSRVHPSETVGSWKMEGFLHYICSDAPEAVALRDRFTFKVIPMLNPDGVVIGNSRTCFTGEDMNRQFLNPDPSLYPESSHVIQLVDDLSLKGRNRIMGYIDMHGHSKRKGSFMYGPYYPLHNENYFKIRIIPKLFSERTPMFRYYSCQFKFENYKRGSARIVMCKEYDVKLCFTIETSLHGYINEEKQTVPYSIPDLYFLGKLLADTILTFDDLMREEKRAKQRRIKERAMKKTTRRKERAVPVVADLSKVNETVDENAFTSKTQDTTGIGKNYRELVMDIKEDENIVKPVEDAESDSESGEEDESGQEYREGILRAIKEFRTLADSESKNQEPETTKSAKPPPKQNASIWNKRKNKSPAILPNIPILKTSKDSRFSVDFASNHRRWGRIERGGRKTDQSTSQNSFCVQKELIQDSILHDEHVKEASESVTRALKIRAERNLSGISYTEMRKRVELAPASIQELQKRLAQLLQTEDSESAVEAIPRSLRKSCENGKSTHSTEELIEVEESQNSRKRSPKLKDPVHPRGEKTSGKFPEVKRRPSLKKMDASPYARFGPFAALPLLNPNVLR